MKIALNEYQIFVAKLFAACEVPDDYPENAPILLDEKKVSDLLELEFIKVGLIGRKEE